jgi:hypothetical protein
VVHNAVVGYVDITNSINMNHSSMIHLKN